MKSSNLKLFSIMPLDVEHIDFFVQDIKEQYENGICSCALFMMMLTPEGNLPRNKAELMCKKFDLFKARLDKLNIPCGVLVQATIGHGYTLAEFPPYQPTVSLKDGSASLGTVCPYDEGFRQYMFDAMATIASHNPAHIMIDDDFRLLSRSTKGCACPLHLAEFNKRAGTNFTREQLLEACSEETEQAEKYWKIFCDVNIDSLILTAKAIRAGIDSVNPSISGSLCQTSGCEAVDACKILAGENNPAILRISNSRYSSSSTKNYSTTFWRAALELNRVNDKVDVFLAETDTCPQNRYSTSALALHTHFVGSLLEGCGGAKQWITRLTAFEPESGVAYRNTLNKYSGLYNELTKIVKDIKWCGARIPLFKYWPKSPNASFLDTERCSFYWGQCVFERIGVPMYFSGENGGVTCLEGNCLEEFSDQEIEKLLSGNVFIASDTAEYLIKRGFLDLIGVDVKEWKGTTIKGEVLLFNGNKIGKQVKGKQLIPISNNVKIESYAYTTSDRENFTNLFPASVVYKNKLGGTIVTFSGTPSARHVISEAYSFLNQSRKEQIVNLFKSMGELPVYYVGDEETYVKAGYNSKGELFVCLTSTAFDPIEKIVLGVDKKVKKVERLTPNGKREKVRFKQNNDKIVIDCELLTLRPEAFFII